MNARQGFVEERTHAYRSVSARDADEQAENLTDWNQTYDQLTPGAFSGSLTEVWFEDIQLFREITNQAVQESGSSWPGSRTFGIPLHMDGTATFCGQAMNRDMVLSLGGNQELDFRTARSMDIVGVALAENVFASFWQYMEATDPGGRIMGRHLVQGSMAKMAELREFIQAVFDVLGERPEILGDAPVRKALRNSILGNLVWVLAASPIEPIAGTAAQRRQLVAWAKAYVLDNVDEPVTVADLCRQLGVSRRQLQYCFQDVLDINPVQYLRAVRLNRVRRELKAGARDGRLCVQDVAGRWGFWHLSHFASDYKKMFCELPSQTLSSALA